MIQSPLPIQKFDIAEPLTSPQQLTHSTDAGIATFGRMPSKKFSKSEHADIKLRIIETVEQQETDANASSALILPENKFPVKTESDNAIVTGMDYKH